jgi:hypothetical protein
VKTCASCGARFAVKQLIEGKMRTLSSRRFCLDCSPFGAHNTSKTPPGKGEDLEQHRRRRRTASWRRYQKKRLHQFKERLIALKGGRCVDCGYANEIASLEFHHRDAGDKRFRIAGFNGSWSRSLAEAEKCDLVCANCHRIRHALAHDRTSRHAVTRARRRMKARAIDERGGRCERCGYDRHRAALEFHHRDGGTKEFGLAQDGVARSWARVAAELRKCDLLCANCHREAHQRLALERATSASVSPS